MNPETLDALKQATDELDEMTKVFYDKVECPSADPQKQWPTYYELTRMCYVMQSMMKAVNRFVSDQTL